MTRVNVSISAEARAALHRAAGSVQAKTGRPTGLSEAVLALVRAYEGTESAAGARDRLKVGVDRSWRSASLRADSEGCLYANLLDFLPEGDEEWAEAREKAYNHLTPLFAARGKEIGESTVRDLGDGLIEWRFSE